MSIPSQIGPYRIVHQIGEGGMGTVFEGIQESIERRVAIKVLHAEYAKNADVTARFFNEARAVNRIEHPGLVQISDYGQLPDGTTYLVMEYLKGESLGSRLGRGRLHVAQALIIAWQVADALSAAHEKGIVHREPNPELQNKAKEYLAQIQPESGPALPPSPPAIPKNPSPVPSPQVISFLPSASPMERKQRVPIYKRPWFWGVMGVADAVVVGGVVTGVVLGTRRSATPDFPTNVSIQNWSLRSRP